NYFVQLHNRRWARSISPYPLRPFVSNTYMIELKRTRNLCQAAGLVGIQPLSERQILGKELSRDDIRYRSKQFSDVYLCIFCLHILHCACSMNGSTCYTRQVEKNGGGG